MKWTNRVPRLKHKKANDFEMQLETLAFELQPHKVSFFVISFVYYGRCRYMYLRSPGKHYNSLQTGHQEHQGSYSKTEIPGDQLRLLIRCGTRGTSGEAPMWLFCSRRLCTEQRAIPCSPATALVHCYNKPESPSSTRTFYWPVWYGPNIPLSVSSDCRRPRNGDG